ncbi:MAG: ATP-dependent metallopeptidase FtsH/Yme1/Tma family protein [Spirochaetales bacterium]|nr:ATP-dependent metallopeptidase FtsH/Yme1/Tma family protein [Spirochaetales bacterium]
MNDDDKDNKGPGGPQPPFDFRKNRLALVLFLVVIGLLAVILFSNDFGTTKTIPYSTFLEYLDQGKVESVVILDQDEIDGTLSSPSGPAVPFMTRIPYIDLKLLDELRAKNVRISGGQKSVPLLKMFLDFMPLTIGIILIWMVFRQVQGGTGKAFGFGKSRAKKYNEKGKRLLFSDVAGQEEAKHELTEVVDFLKSPEKFTAIGAKIPKGVLLVGMPGTGKTLLAKAVAGEANVNFFHMSGSDFVEMFVGVGASRVRDLFENGRQNSPCIIFIDEIDAVGRTRGAGYGGGHDEREQTLNQLLVEMDGFDTKDGVIVIAATNRPDVLDPALLRPGRFDRQVVVDMPDVKEREAILTLHASKVKLAPDVDLLRLARATPGSSGADIANIVNEAALFAARRGQIVVSMQDFEEARDKILMGIARRSKVITPKDKLATAYHEAGHALLHYYLKDADPLHKVTVVPRGRALGVAFSLPDEDKYSRGKNWLMDRIRISFGGFAAEELIYGETSTGVQNDLEQATSMARRMITEWGMSERIGPMALGSEGEPIFLGKEIATHKDYSEETARQVDNEIRSLLTNCLNDVRGLLKEHREQLEKLANELVVKETLDDSDIRNLLGFAPRVAITVE